MTVDDDGAACRTELRWDFVADPPTRLLAELNLARARLRRGEWRDARRAAKRLLRHLDAEPTAGLSGLMPARRAEIRADGLAVAAITATLLDREDRVELLAASLEAYESLRQPEGGLRPSGLAGYGMVLSIAGRHDEAAKPLARAAEAGEDVSVQLVRTVTRTLLDEGDAPRAIRLLRAVHERYPNEAELAAELAEAYDVAGQPDEAAAAHVDVGSLLADSGRLDLALEHFDRASIAVPDHPLAALGRCQTLVALGRAEQALVDLAELRRTQPLLAGAAVVAALAEVELGRPQEALADIEQALEEFPDDLWSLDARVRVLVALGRPRDAIDAVDAALTVDPTDRLWRGLRAELQVGLGEDVDTALQILRQLADAPPNAAHASIRLTRALRASGRAPEALDVVSAALEEQPQNRSLIVLEVELLRELDRAGEAVEAGRRALQRGVPRRSIALPLARALVDAGDIDEAAAIAEEEVAERPSLRARAVLGLARHGAGRYDEAVVELEAALADPECDPGVRPALAASLVATGVELLQAPDDDDAALERFARAIELDPDNVDARRWSAEAYRMKRDFVKALEHADLGLDLEPDHGWLLGTRGQILESITGKEAQAEADLRRALELNPDLNWARVELGDLLRVRKRHQDALVVLGEAVERAPDDPWPLASLGAAQYAVDDYDAALSSLTRALDVADDYAWAHAALSTVYTDIDSLQDAKSHIVRALEIDPAMGWAWNQLGWVELLGAFADDGTVQDPAAGQRALEAYESALDPGGDDLVDPLYGEACMLLGRGDEAMATFDEAAKRIRGNRHADAAELARLGWCELRLGNHDDAVDALVSAMAVDTTNVSAALDLALALLCAGRRGIALEEYARALGQLRLLPHEGRRRGLLHVARRDLSSLSIDQLARDDETVAEVRGLLAERGGAGGTDDPEHVPLP